MEFLRFESVASHDVKKMPKCYKKLKWPTFVSKKNLEKKQTRIADTDYQLTTWVIQDFLWWLAETQLPGYLPLNCRVDFLT